MPRRRHRRWPAVAAAAAALGAAGVGLALARPGGSGRDHPGSAGLARWNSAAAGAFTPWAGRVAVMSQYVQQWQAGSLSTSGFVVQLERTAQLLDRTEAAAGRMPPYPGAPAVDAMYRDAAQLYVASNQVLVAATGVAPGTLRDQLVLMSERVRELGDRTFDQGRVLTAAGLLPAGLPAGSKVELPAEVPDWVAEGLEAGPPLAPPPPAAAAFPPLRQGVRPTEARSTWVQAVTALGAGRLVELSADAAQLEAQAADLEKETAAIQAMPDPAVVHGREASDRLRLSLLTEAEACRAAQAAAVVPAGAQLRAAATALLATARTIRVPSLP